jgi:hypothetical protein
MRWKFAGDTARADKLRLIDDWWLAFQSKTAQLDALFRNREKWDLPQWMYDHLGAIDENLCWEFGAGVNGGHRLVITPESRRELRPLVETILARAPKLAGWEFYPYRLAETVTQAQGMLEAFGLPPLPDARVLATPGAHNLIDLTFLAPTVQDIDDERALHAAFKLTEVILGEDVLDSWIGGIRFEKATTPALDAVALSEMRRSVEKCISQMKENLPLHPAWHDESAARGTVWQLEPQRHTDYAGQLDMFVGRSMHPDMWMAAHSDAPFYSERFSAHGETFCYVKIDGTVDLSGELFKDKAEIENALDAVLIPAKTGAGVGGGTGLRYSYIDLALSDLEKGISQIIGVLREGKINERTWILFFDDIYREEWVGVWDHSPPPPGLTSWR